MTVAVALVLLPAACTSAGSSSAKAPPATTRSTVAPTTTTLDPTTTAILAAYRAGWASYIAAAESFPVNPNDPQLALHDTGNELTSERKALTRLNMLGHYNQGATDLAPVVTGLSDNSATITDCVFDHSFEVDAQTKLPVEAADIGHTLYRFQLTQSGGVWFVSDSTMLKSGKTGDACTPSSA